MSTHTLARWAALALMTGLLVTACGGGGSTASGPGSTQGASTSAFQKCLKQHGVSLPTARPSFSGTPSPGASFPGGGHFPGGGQGGAAGKAFQACRKYAPGGFRAGGVNASALAAFASCLRQHGVKISGSGFGALQSLRNATGKTAKAVKICRPLLPQAAPPTASSG